MLTPRSLALVLPLLTACARTYLFPVLALAACTASPPPTDMIPAAAVLVVGVDIAAVLATRTYGRHELALRRDILPWIDWLYTARDCGLDPIRSHMTMIVGTDNGEELAAMFTGDGIGDADRLRCLADSLAAEHGPQPFSIHDSTHPGLAADHGLVATIVDPRTVVFATHGWAAQVHDLVLGHGPAYSPPARVDRGAPVWYALRPVRGLADAREVHGLLDLDDGVRFTMRVIFDPDSATHHGPPHDRLGDRTSLIFCELRGLNCRKREWTANELQLETAVPLDRAHEIARPITRLVRSLTPASPGAPPRGPDAAR